MKKFTKAFLVAICALTATFAFSACFNNDDTSSGDASVSETSFPATSSEIPEVSSDEESSREESVAAGGWRHPHGQHHRRRGGAADCAQ